jgi:DMSO reductase anchor subunit
MVPARPAWNSRYTLAEFFSTALLLGPMFVRALDPQTLMGAQSGWITRVAIAGGAAQLLTQSLKFLWMSRSEGFELRASALLLSSRLQKAFVARLAVLVLAGIVLPLETHSTTTAAAALLLGLAGEWLGRWLFFVSVVPKSIAAAFTSVGRAA